MSLPALHVDSGGIIRDSSNTIVYLRGVNTAGLEFGNALGADISQARVSAVTRLFSVNLWRLCINTSWWNNNVLLTDGVTYYRAWIREIIGWIEVAGCYVEIDPTTMFNALPSAGVAQNYVDGGNSTSTLVINSVTSFFTSFIPLYQHDPAMLYNALNEPGDGLLNSQITNANVISTNQSLINTIHGLAPNGVIFISGQSYASVVAGLASDYAGNNLVLDYHFYDFPGDWWYDKFYRDNYGALTWPTAKAYGHGVMVGEWNVSGWNPTGFASECVRRAFSQQAALAYYNEQNLLNSDNVTPTTQGQIVANAYQQIATGQKVWYG